MDGCSVMTVPEPGITVRELVRATERLEALAVEMNASVWLAERGRETPSDMADDIACRLLALAHMLSRPIQPRPTAERWQGSNGHRER